MKFIPLHYADKLTIIDPKGRVGVITGWSSQDYVVGKLAAAGVDLDPATSEIAVIGNLYGNGIPQLLRNLLYNPQIRDLIICGDDKDGAGVDLARFFATGARVRNMDDMVTLDMFKEVPRVRLALSQLISPNTLKRQLDAMQIPDPATTERIEVPMPEIAVTTYPSCPQDHNVVAGSPLRAWKVLVYRLSRFGRLVHLRKGDRQELQDVKVVITRKDSDTAEELADWGFTQSAIEDYQTRILDPNVSAGTAYTYGQRIGEHFGYNFLDTVEETLRSNAEARGCYLALWDSYNDVSAEDQPCLTSLFFRVFDGALTLTATFRTHNAVDAWLLNVYGLLAIQANVARSLDIDAGPLTVMSHSLSIDPARYEVAQRVIDARRFEMVVDPNGQFLISADLPVHAIVCEHRDNDGNLLHVYRAQHAERIQHELARDCAISDINHAMHVGRELARAEQAIRQQVVKS